MKKILFPLILGILLVCSLVWADGGLFIDYSDLAVTMPSQKAVISWDGEKEIMILSTKITAENLANIAWVVPVQSKTKPEISEGDIQVFHDVADVFFVGAETAPGWTLGVESAGQGGVEIVEFNEVDIYDITTLKATDATALANWLNDNGYIVPEATIPVLQGYCDQENFYFIANKIDLANKYKDLVITAEDEMCADAILSQYGRFGSEMRWILEEMESYILEGLEYDFEDRWEGQPCGGASVEGVKTLLELSNGLATPIKIEFQPNEAFYPLKISSINEGRTIVDVYVFSQTPVKDKSNVLDISQMVKTYPELKRAFEADHGLGYDYISYLTYSGNLKDLSTDAWFESTEYEPSLDPNYVSPGSKAWDVFSSIISLLFYLLPIAIVIFAIIGFVWVVKKFICLFRKKRIGKKSKKGNK